MEGNTNINVQDIIDEHFIKSIDSILIAKRRKINIMNSLEYKALEKMYIAKNHFNKEKSVLIIDMPNAIEETGYSDKVESEHIIHDIGKQEKMQNEKMPSCGTWFDECCNCCYIPLKCMESSHYLSSKCCRIFTNRLKQLYFFILYLFTGELNREALGYKKYFNVKPVSDDNVNVPEIVITATSIVFELYKTLIGSFLTVFTSQRCGQQTCTIWENIVPKNDLELVGIIFNFLMATALLIEYIFEIMREAYLIKYLKYDKTLANNGEHIAELYENADKAIFTKLIPLYIIYIRFSYVVLFVYFVNVILSAIIVAENYYDNTSIFSFVTNALFIIYKIYNVVEITSYRGDYFYSAYKRKNIHYNTIKPKYLLKANLGDDCEDDALVDIEQPSVNVPSDPVVEPVAIENIVVDIENSDGFASGVSSYSCELRSPEYFTQPAVEPNPEAITIDLDSIFNGKFALPVENYTPQKTVEQVIKEVEHLDYDDQREIIDDLFERNYIDKRDYRKLSLFLRKTELGGLTLHKG